MNAGRTDPQRTGLFGALTVGFAVAALLTVLGFFLYSFLSFERRLLQMGILRAMGLSIGQLFGLLIFEQVFLIAHRDRLRHRPRRGDRLAVHPVPAGRRRGADAALRRPDGLDRHPADLRRARPDAAWLASRARR